MEMRDACRYSILCNWTYLKKNFNPPNIIDELYNGGFVDEDRAEIIKEKPRREMVYSTLRNIVRRIDQPETLSELISILKRANLFFPEELKDIAARKPFAVSNEYGENIFYIANHQFVTAIKLLLYCLLFIAFGELN